LFKPFLTRNARSNFHLSEYAIMQGRSKGNIFKVQIDDIQQSDRFNL